MFLSCPNALIDRENSTNSHGNKQELAPIIQKLYDKKYEENPLMIICI